MSIISNLLQRETERNITFAFQYGYKVLPVAVAPSVQHFGVWNHYNHLMCTCVLIEHAAEIAAALAAVNGAPATGAFSSQSQAGESLAPGLAQGEQGRA